MRLLAFNARSIGKNPKRANVLNFLKKKDPDIIIITETNIGKNIETTIRDEWDGKVLFSSFDAQSRGVCAFIKKKLPLTVIKNHKDDRGNLLALLVEYEGKRILIEGIYGPNEDNPDFYTNDVFSKIDEWEAEFSIFAGDWNVTLDPTKDNKNYLHDNNRNARRALLNKIEEKFDKNFRVA